MPFAIEIAGVLSELAPAQPFTDAQGYQRPGNWLDHAAPQEIAGAGVYPITDDAPVPYGQVATSKRLVRSGTSVARVATLADVAIADLKEAKIKAIQAARANAAQTFSFNGQTIPLTRDTRQDINDAVDGLSKQAAGAVIHWEIVDGVYVDMTVDQLSAMGEAAFQKTQACFTVSKAMSAQVAAANSADDLAAISVNTGWPA